VVSLNLAHPVRWN